MPDLVVPIVHLNGSGLDSLMEACLDQITAIDEAIAVMRQNTPHGRDYYPLGDAAHTQAVEQHMARIAKLQSVCDEVMSIAVAVSEGKSEVGEAAS